jgi:hypothetical protein
MTATVFVIGGNSFHSSQAPVLRVNASTIRTMLTMMATPVRAGTTLSARTWLVVYRAPADTRVRAEEGAADRRCCPHPPNGRV